MTDKKLLAMFKQIKKEMIKRYGRKMCSELHSGCGDCKVRMMLAYVDDEIDMLSWWIEREDKFKKQRNHKK